MEFNLTSPAVVSHGELIAEKNSYFYFINNASSKFTEADTAEGPLIIAYTDEQLAQDIYFKLLKDNFRLQRIDNVDMKEFYRLMNQAAQPSESLAGVAMNLPLEFINGEGDLIFEAQLPLHMFVKDELSE